MKSTWISRSPAQTMRLGRLLAKEVQRGDVIGLVGPLGSGKTLFIKGFCEGLGIDPTGVLSPTFTLIHHYSGRIPVYHFDAYRLKNGKEFEDLGYEELFFGEGVSLVEWADKVRKFLPEGSRILTFEIADARKRKISSVTYSRRRHEAAP